MKSIKTISIIMVIFAMAFMGVVSLNVKPSHAQYDDIYNYNNSVYSGYQLIYINGLYYLCPSNYNNGYYGNNYWSNNLGRCILLNGYYNNNYYGGGFRYRDRDDFNTHRHDRDDRGTRGGDDRGNRGIGNDHGNRGIGNERGVNRGVSGDTRGINRGGEVRSNVHNGTISGNRGGRR